MIAGNDEWVAISGMLRKTKIPGGEVLLSMFNFKCLDFHIGLI